MEHFFINQILFFFGAAKRYGKSSGTKKRFEEKHWKYSFSFQIIIKIKFLDENACAISCDPVVLNPVRLVAL
jgi:hypothetical protein